MARCQAPALVDMGCPSCCRSTIGGNIFPKTFVYRSETGQNRPMWMIPADKTQSKTSSAEGAEGEGSVGSLAARACEGDGAAFERLARKHYRDLYGFALMLTGKEADACDVAQDALLKAFQKIRSYRREAPFRTWLLQIARNAFYDRARRESREHRKAARLRERSVSEQVMDPERAMFRKQTHKKVHSALSEVPELFREVVILFDLNGLSYQEISEVVGVPMGTVKSRLRRGREAFCQRMKAITEAGGKGETGGEKEGDEGR